MCSTENKQRGCARHHHDWNDGDQKAMETVDLPEIQPMAHECDCRRETDIAHLKADDDVHPEPELGHPVPYACQPNSEQKTIY